MGGFEYFETELVLWGKIWISRTRSQQNTPKECKQF